MIVLMTDFGESEYVGAMKGVILSIAPATQIIDLTHSISPQSVREGAWVLLQNYQHFPHNAIFVCVVDPGVGTGRDAVLVDTTHYMFIGPDNGLMYPAIMQDGIKQIFSLSIDEHASNTFHGRDVFALTAGNLERRVVGRHLGPYKTALDVEFEFHQDGREGEVVRIDRFGNIVTNLPSFDYGSVSLSTNLEDRPVSIMHCRTYQDGPDEGLFVITGSSNTLEISAKNSRASDGLPLKVGDRLTIE
ncbi:MAG: SAM hydrolase/SAM-dependent halogenase family protein [Candidatus Thorarchaeota archaeon]|jgi:S-adenosylmethionine hydrolase